MMLLKSASQVITKPASARLARRMTHIARAEATGKK